MMCCFCCSHSGSSLVDKYANVVLNNFVGFTFVLSSYIQSNIQLICFHLYFLAVMVFFCLVFLLLTLYCFLAFMFSFSVGIISRSVFSAFSPNSVFNCSGWVSSSSWVNIFAWVLVIALSQVLKLCNLLLYYLIWCVWVWTVFVESYLFKFVTIMYLGSILLLHM